MSVVEDFVTNTIKEVRALASVCKYDGRPYLFSDEYDMEWKSGEKFRRGYMCVKYAVSAITKPKRICEIGVCTGIGAIAMLSASPEAEYVGVDNLNEETMRNDSFVARALEQMLKMNFKATVIVDDSQKMEALPFPKYDLIHVDGCHTREACRHDVTLAWHALNDDGWILVDDGRDVFVATGTFEALANLPGGNVYWGYFEDTTGSILIHKRRS